MTITPLRNGGGMLPRGLSIVQSGADRARVPRRPKHPFHITQYPYELTPFFMAPVLPGETMKQLLLQTRSVSDSLKNRLIGAHLEHYFFYVKLRDLADRDDIEDMILGSGTSVDTSSGDVYHFTAAGAPKWSEMCMDAVLKSYFRDEGDTGSHVGGTTGLPLVMWENKNSFMESLIDDADIATDAIEDTQPFGEHEKAYEAWLFARQMQMTELDFEDYLASFGVRMAPGEEKNKPELVRFTKNWSYPTNTVEGDGTINTQYSWSVMERADKDRFIKEPGFLVGYTVFRPKVYCDGRTQTANSLLSGPLDWLPAIMKDHVHTSLRQFDPSSAAASPFAAASEPAAGQLDSDNTYWIDIRDLFVYGDFFTNMTLDSNINAVNPEDIGDFHGKKYPDDTGLQALGSSGLTVESDGIVSLNILGTQMDMT